MRNRSKDTRADRFALLVDNNNSILIKPNFATITALSLHSSTNNDTVDDLPLLHLAAGDGILDRGDDEVTKLSVLATAEDLDAGDALGSGVVRDFQASSHLNK